MRFVVRSYEANDASEEIDDGDPTFYARGEVMIIEAEGTNRAVDLRLTPAESLRVGLHLLHHAYRHGEEPPR